MMIFLFSPAGGSIPRLLQERQRLGLFSRQIRLRLLGGYHA